MLAIFNRAKDGRKAESCHQISDRDFLEHFDKNVGAAKREGESWNETIVRLVKYQAINATVAEVYPDDIVDIVRSLDSSVASERDLARPNQRVEEALEPILSGICSSKEGKGIPTVPARISEIFDIIHRGLTIANIEIELECDPGKHGAKFTAHWNPITNKWRCTCIRVVIVGEDPPARPQRLGRRNKLRKRGIMEE